MQGEKSEGKNQTYAQAEGSQWPRSSLPCRVTHTDHAIQPTNSSLRWIVESAYHRRMTMLIDTADESSLAPLTAAACLFHGFSDPSRLVILQHLLLGEHRVVDLTEHLGLAQSTVSKHLACLKDCGLVASRPRGRASMFSVTHPDATAELLASAEKLLELTGYAVTLCPNHGISAHEESGR